MIMKPDYYTNKDPCDKTHIQLHGLHPLLIGRYLSAILFCPGFTQGFRRTLRPAHSTSAQGQAAQAEKKRKTYTNRLPI